MLIVDEFAIWPHDRDSATAFFSLVSARYERGSIILTSNKGFAEWGELLGDTVIATAILDRLLHHSHVLNIRGESYRQKNPRQAGPLTSHTGCSTHHGRSPTTPNHRPRWVKTKPALTMRTGCFPRCLLSPAYLATWGTPL